MGKKKLSPTITYSIAAVWIVNGLCCKILNLVPRHEEIVAEILGNDHSRMLTILIGVSELLMAVWVLSGYKRRLNALTQIAIVASMNILEFSLAPDLLLWGRLNALFALLFILLIYFNEYRLRNETVQKA